MNRQKVKTKTGNKKCIANCDFNSGYKKDLVFHCKIISGCSWNFGERKLWIIPYHFVIQKYIFLRGGGDIFPVVVLWEVEAAIIQKKV